MGTRNLNAVLQELLNPPHSSKAELSRGGIKLRVGDRVIQQVNDYNREVFNGDLGAIAAIDLEEQEVTVQYQERRVTYDYTGQQVSGSDSTFIYAALHDAVAQSTLYRSDPCQAVSNPGRSS